MDVPTNPTNQMAPAENQNSQVAETTTNVEATQTSTSAVGWDGQPLQTTQVSELDQYLQPEENDESDKYAFTRLRNRIQDPEVLSEIKNYERGVAKLAAQKAQYESVAKSIAEEVAPLAAAIQSNDANGVIQFLQRNGFDVSQLGATQAPAPETTELEAMKQELMQYRAQQEQARFQNEIAPQIANYVKEQLGWEVTTQMVDKARKMFPDIDASQIVEAIKMANPDEYANFKLSAPAEQSNGYNPLSAPRRVDGGNQPKVNPFNPMTQPREYQRWLLNNG